MIESISTFKAKFLSQIQAPQLSNFAKLGSGMALWPSIFSITVRVQSVFLAEHGHRKDNYGSAF